MRVSTKLVLAAALAVIAAGCGADTTDAELAEATATSPAPVSEGAAEVAEERSFDRETFGGKECVVIDAAEVAEIAGVAFGEVSENRGAKCLFAWSDGSAIVQLTAHKTAQRARQHFETFNEDVTAEEIKAAKVELDQKLDDEVAEGEMTEQQAEIGSKMAHQMPEVDITHQSLSGLGDDASVDSRGKIMVRVGNLTFNVAAKSGGADDIDPELSRKIAERVVDNLETM